MIGADVDWVRGLYAILDVGPRLPMAAADAALDALIAGGAPIVQLRVKDLGDHDWLALAKRCRAATAARHVRLIVNDRVDIAMLAGADGVHLGQDDLPATTVAGLLSAKATALAIGLSCHDLAQVRAAAGDGAATYLGYGPVFVTTSKARPDPVVGLEGLAAAKQAAGACPVVAIGGITVAQIRAVRATGADAVAMIGALLHCGDITEQTAAAVLAMEGGG